jgi:hypothetical protein
MPKSSQHPQHPPVPCSFTTAGPITSSCPASLEQEHMSSAALTQFTCALPSVTECTLAFYSKFAHFETRNSVNTALSIVRPDLVVSKDTFPAGRLTNPKTPTTDVNDETVFLTLAVPNQVSTEIRMLEEIIAIWYSVSISLIPEAGSWASPAN